MNKRQKKKAFKKKYGFNPTETKAVVEMEWSDVAKEAVLLGKRMKETLEYISNVIIPLMAENMKKVMEETSNTIRNVIDEVKTMSDEEWEEYKKILNGEQIALLEHMRKKWSEQ